IETTLTKNTQAVIEEIKQLNTEIEGAYAEICNIADKASDRISNLTKITLPKAVIQGERLVQLKQQCPTDHWTGFCETKLSFKLDAQMRPVIMAKPGDVLI